ncbi:MAG: 2-oxo acid dehydrogenase subunit E2, partial [Bacteroidetes bacterium]|nr:2-oxo acid dehydrogenase subunit E2 [Bacteroidota bacterium]
MSRIDLLMPKLGESIVEATILKWHKQPGDHVEADESVLDIATDKVDSEVPSTATGVIDEILFKENDVVAVGQVIARIRTETGEEANDRSSEPQQQVNIKHQEVEEIPFQPMDTPEKKPVSSIRFYSPLVLNIAASEGISMSELEAMEGTGQDGRVSKKDILNFLDNRNKKSSQPQLSQATAIQELPVQRSEVKSIAPVMATGNVEIIEMDRMRKMIAKHMIDSQNTSAHVTSFTECDVTNLVLWRNNVKKEFEKREGEKITFTPLFIEAVIRGIKKYPLINSSVDGERIIIKKDINIGMATAMPNGNLIVPVIKNADQLNLTGLTKQVNSLANAARNNQLKPDDTAGGT